MKNQDYYMMRVGTVDNRVLIDWDVVERTAKEDTMHPLRAFALVMLAIRNNTWQPLTRSDS